MCSSDDWNLEGKQNPISSFIANQNKVSKSIHNENLSVVTIIRVIQSIKDSATQLELTDFILNNLEYYIKNKDWVNINKFLLMFIPSEWNNYISLSVLDTLKPYKEELPNWYIRYREYAKDKS